MDSRITVLANINKAVADENGMPVTVSGKVFQETGESVSQFFTRVDFARHNLNHLAELFKGQARFAADNGFAVAHSFGRHLQDEVNIHLV